MPRDRAFCVSAYENAWSLRETVKPRDDDDKRIKDVLRLLLATAPSCVARAGDCDGAFTIYKEIARELFKGTARANDEAALRSDFARGSVRCKK